MRLNSSLLLLLAAVVCNAHAEVPRESKEFLTIRSYEVRHISTDVLNQQKIDTIYRKSLELQQDPLPLPFPGQIPYDPIDQVGRVIGVAQNLVALGESVYNLVIKGKPTTKTDYAPISVIPRVGKNPVDIFETEGWSVPLRQTYEYVYKNYYGITVLSFKFSIIYSYGGSYNGTGKYLTGLQVIPEQVRVLYGFDFTATMKLGGIQNQGRRDNPLAAATILLEHNLSSIVVAHTAVDSFFIVANGRMKKL